MTDAIQWVLDQHSWKAYGVRYEVALHGWQFEQRESPDGALDMLRVELLAAADTMKVPARLDLVVDLALLPELALFLEDALRRLHEHLLEKGIASPPLRFAS